MRVRLAISLLFLCVNALLMSCSKHVAESPQPPLQNWSQAMQYKINEYGASSREQLTPYLQRKNLPYPPSDLAFLIFKNTKVLELWAKRDPNASWQYVRRYRVYAASGGPGPKLQEGDHQVPEGIYHIVGLNPMSHFDLSMQLNYPNAFDTAEARAAGRTHLGRDIYIHGDKLSVGCVALGDHTIEQLFPLVYATGIKHVTVIIAPNDLRRKPPLEVADEPNWVPMLYHEINLALNGFPSTNKLTIKQQPILAQQKVSPTKTKTFQHSNKMLQVATAKEKNKHITTTLPAAKVSTKIAAASLSTTGIIVKENQTVEKHISTASN